MATAVTGQLETMSEDVAGFTHLRDDLPGSSSILIFSFAPLASKDALPALPVPRSRRANSFRTRRAGLPQILRSQPNQLDVPLVLLVSVMFDRRHHFDLFQLDPEPLSFDRAGASAKRVRCATGVFPRIPDFDGPTEGRCFSGFDDGYLTRQWVLAFLRFGLVDV